ncbi:unnamed protein product [Ectocarpus sp. 12 AP-2014]
MILLQVAAASLSLANAAVLRMKLAAADADAAVPRKRRDDTFSTLLGSCWARVYACALRCGTGAGDARSFVWRESHPAGIYHTAGACPREQLGGRWICRVAANI